VDLSVGDKALVTAFLHSLVWFQHSTTHPWWPLCLTGQVTWVGNSSLEVTLELTRQLTCVAQTLGSSQELKQQHLWEGETVRRGMDTAQTPALVPLVARARFIMAARDTSLARALSVPRLVCSTPEEELLQAQGTARQHERHHRRQQEASQLAASKPGEPCTHTHEDLDHLLRRVSGAASMGCDAGAGHVHTVPIRSTQLSQTFLAQYQASDHLQDVSFAVELWWLRRLGGWLDEKQ
jgi:acyl-CoA hydrolase